MCIPPIRISLSCNSDCNRTCPRVLRVFCCCTRCDNDEQLEEIVNTTANNVLKNKRERSNTNRVKKKKRHKSASHVKRSEHRSDVACGVTTGGRAYKAK